MIALSYILYRILLELITNLLVPLCRKISDRYEQLLDFRNHGSSKDEKRIFEVFRILYRKKAYTNPGDVARDVDFIIWPRSTESIEILEDSHWTLYCMTSEWVYFCYTEKTISDMQARSIPFIHQTQFDEAQKIARITIAQFALFEPLSAFFKPKIIYISNVPRAGTTLFTAMIQASDKIIALSEPNILTSISTLKESGIFSSDQIRTLIRSVFGKLCLDFRDKNSVIVIKPQSNGGIIAEDVDAAMPGCVKHIFLYRRNVDKCMASIEKMLNVNGMLSDYVWLVNRSRWLADQLIGFSKFMPLLLNYYPVHDTLAVAGLFVIGPLSWFASSAAEKVNFHVVCFEELTTSPKHVMEDVFRFLGINGEKFKSDNEEEGTTKEGLIDSAIAVLKQDSQTGTSLSQERLKHLKVSPLTPKRRAEFDLVCKSLGLPPMFVVGMVPDL